MHTVKHGALEYESSENITAAHAFTTRLGGVSGGYLASLNIGYHRGDEPENVAENYGILGKTIGFQVEDTVFCHQIHSDIVRTVTKQDALGIDHHLYPESDALITKDPGTALVVFTADCTPILLHDPVTGAVGAVHAGWRGTAADIAGKAVGAMAEKFGCEASDIRAAIGPNIGFCCFETGPEVPKAMLETYGKTAGAYIRLENEKYYVNLKAINALALRRAGVENIEISNDCTMCSPQRYWSHRATGGIRGSQGAVIVCEEAKK